MGGYDIVPKGVYDISPIDRPGHPPRDSVSTADKELRRPAT